MPRVSVITPNYNYARFLPQRLDSILSQTFRDFELIVLDNASTDDSRRIIESYLHDPRVRAVFNRKNNGSVFKQWNLGLRQSTGEYVWIAESDDYAEPTLLETLVDRLDRHPNAGLAVCQSWIVDEEGRPDPDGHTGQRYGWREDFVASGRDFCREHMRPANRIVNASAVVFRRRVLEEAGGAPEHLRLCGDYLTYVEVLCRSDIACVASPLNYFRTHRSTTRSRTSSLVYLREVRDVLRRIDDHFGLGERDRHYRELLPYEVARIIHPERRPPHNKVPPLRALGLLRRLAREDVRGFGIALRTLAREQAADLARRLRLLGLVRALSGVEGARR